MNKKNLLLLFTTSLFFFYQCTVHHYCTSQQSIQKEHIVIKEQNTDSSMYKLILPYKIKIDNDLNVKIAYTNKSLEKNFECNNLAQLVYESLNWFADSVLQNKYNYAVLLNYGGLRANIPQGDIFKKNIFELMPFDNTIVILQLNDEQKNELLQNTNHNKKLLVKSKTTENANILVTSDYLYQGGDDCVFLKSAKKINTFNYFIRDAIIRYCTIKKQLDISCFH